MGHEAMNAVISERKQVLSTLEQLGLNVEGLVAAVRYADAERALCTRHDPKGFELILMNARTARALRDVFVGEHWEVDETDNQPGIKNPALKIRIIPCNFDKNAGNRLATPSNLRDKGFASRSKAQCNITEWLPGFEPEAVESDDGYETYVLGTFAAESEPIRAELSKPLNFASGRFTEFLPRIILLDGSENESDIRATAPRDGPTEIIDIAIKRK